MTLTWIESERLFKEADAHKPVDKRFEGWKQSQTEARNRWWSFNLRVELLFFPTGEGKSKTSLAIMAETGVEKLLVVAPKATHAAWRKDAATLGLKLYIVNINTFRMDTYKPPRGAALIFDEFHQAGGRGGDGFKKLKKLKNGFTHIVLCSATPNYNDAERVYCALVIGDPTVDPNYGEWVKDNCRTEVNRFAYYPKVLGFLYYDSAIDFLCDLDWVSYVEDTATWEEYEFRVPVTDLDELNKLGLSRRHKRIMASDMEDRHKRRELELVDDDGWIRQEIIDPLLDAMWSLEENGSAHEEPWLVFAYHKEVAKAFRDTIVEAGDTYYIDGDIKEDEFQVQLQGFLKDPYGILIGTTALATGTDGIDKHCRLMLILDDIVGDDSLRRQLIGRILPRGTDDGETRKVVFVRVSDQYKEQAALIQLPTD